MKEIVNKTKCSGCHACLNICPKKAIKMVNDEKGFKYPVIDQKKCIDCGLCKKTCPILNKVDIPKYNVKAYACYNLNDEELLNSSSGGIFILLAKEIIKRNGVIFGAGFDKDYSVSHKYIENEHDLIEFMGSKYVQSTIGNSYIKAKEFLDKDRYVLFTGTPCQIEGLKSFLKKDYPKLYTQDIICHGVPSPNVWKKYLEFQKEKNNNENINNISFRNKEHGWSLYHLRISFDKKTYSNCHKDDLYMRAFIDNICLRDSCYNCSFKKKHHVADITLGDYWGISKIHPNMNSKKGVSAFIIHSQKGEELFNAIKDNTKYIETDLDSIISSNSSMIKSANHHKNEEMFNSNIDNMKFDKLVNKYVNKNPVHKRIIRKIKRNIKNILNK